MALLTTPSESAWTKGEAVENAHRLVSGGGNLPDGQSPGDVVAAGWLPQMAYWAGLIQYQAFGEGHLSEDIASLTAMAFAVIRQATLWQGRFTAGV